MKHKTNINSNTQEVNLRLLGVLFIIIICSPFICKWGVDKYKEKRAEKILAVCADSCYKTTILDNKRFVDEMTKWCLSKNLNNTSDCYIKFSAHWTIRRVDEILAICTDSCYNTTMKREFNESL